MEIEALPPEAGVARASIGGIEHFRAIDLASKEYGIPGVAGAAIRLFMEEHRLPAHISHKLEKRGRYIPMDQLALFVSSMKSPETAKRANGIFFGALQNRKSARTAAEIERLKEASLMHPTPITTTPLYVCAAGTVMQMTAPSLRDQVYLFDDNLGLYFQRSTIMLTVTNCRTIAKIEGFVRKIQDSDELTIGSPGRGGGSPVMIHERRLQDFLQCLKASRGEYRADDATKLMARVEELRLSLAGRIAAVGLSDIPETKIAGGLVTLPAATVLAKAASETVSKITGGLVTLLAADTPSLPLPFSTTETPAEPAANENPTAEQVAMDVASRSPEPFPNEPEPADIAELKVLSEPVPAPVPKSVATVSEIMAKLDRIDANTRPAAERDAELVKAHARIAELEGQAAMRNGEVSGLIERNSDLIAENEALKAKLQVFEHARQARAALDAQLDAQIAA